MREQRKARAWPLLLALAAVPFIAYASVRQSLAVAETDAHGAMPDSLRALLAEAETVSGRANEEVNRRRREVEAPPALRTYVVRYDCQVDSQTVTVALGMLDENRRLHLGGWYTLAPGDSLTFTGYGSTFLVGPNERADLSLSGSLGETSLLVSDSDFEWQAQVPPGLASLSSVQIDQAEMDWISGAPQGMTPFRVVQGRAELACR